MFIERRTRSDSWAPNRIGGLLDATSVEQEKKMRLPVDTDAEGSLHNPSASTTRSTNDGASLSSATVRAADAAFVEATATLQDLHPETTPLQQTVPAEHSTSAAPSDLTHSFPRGSAVGSIQSLRANPDTFSVWTVLLLRPRAVYSAMILWRLQKRKPAATAVLLPRNRKKSRRGAPTYPVKRWIR